MTFHRRLRPLDFVLLAAIVAAIVLWFAVRQASGEDQTLETAIEEAATAWANEGNLASARAMFALANMAEERAGDTEAAGLLRTYALAVAYGDDYRVRAAIDDLFNTDNPIAVALVSSYREQNTYTLQADPIDVDPAIPQGIAAGLKSVDLTVPDAPGGFPEQHAGLVDWQSEGAGDELVVNGVVSFPPRSESARIGIGKGSYPFAYELTISVTLAGPLFNGAAIAHVDRVAFGFPRSEATPILADNVLTGDLSFEVRIPIEHPEAWAGFVTERQLNFDITLSDGRRVLLEAMLSNFGDEPTNPVFDQAFAAWGLTPTSAE